MLCGLLLLGRSVEGVMYNLMYLRMAEKEKDYQNLPVKNTLDIFAAIEVSFPSEYEFTEKTEVIILDSLRKKSLVKKNDTLVKLLGNGELTKKLEVSLDKISASAKEKIEKAGGKVVAELNKESR